ncbi:MAG: ankyrin repeat domain-containing protein [Desulfomonilaceae bacterium]
MSARSARVLRVISTLLVIGLVLVLIPSPDIARACHWNRASMQDLRECPTVQVGSLSNTNGHVHFVAETDQMAGGTEESKEHKIQVPPEASGTEQRPAVGGGVNWALLGENVAVGEAQQIAKFADKVSRKGSTLFLRLKGGRVVSRDSTPRDQEGESSEGDNYRVRYVFYDFINPWYVVGLHLYEGGITQFINRGTGAVVNVDGYPLFSPDKTRFVAIGYPGASSSGAEIWRVSRKGIVSEWDLGDTGLYRLRWSGPSAIEVVAHDEVVARFKRHGTAWRCSGSSSICKMDRVIMPSNKVAEVHATDKEGCTELERASAAGDIEAVRHLLKMNADVNARDEKGGTALIHATRGGQLGVVKLLP